VKFLHSYCHVYATKYEIVGKFSLFKNVSHPKTI